MKTLELSDLILIGGNNRRVVGRVSAKNIGANGYHGCVHYSQFNLKESPNFSNGFQTFFETQIIKNFGQITNKELEEQYPEYII